jgi:hypothetical protein
MLRKLGFTDQLPPADAGKKFWKVTKEMPVSKDGRVAWPRLVPIIPNNKWNRKDYGVMPTYEAVREIFGAEVATADGPHFRSPR